jgi:hypothetical protein
MPQPPGSTYPQLVIDDARRLWDPDGSGTLTVYPVAVVVTWEAFPLEAGRLAGTEGERHRWMADLDPIVVQLYDAPAVRGLLPAAKSKPTGTPRSRQAVLVELRVAINKAANDFLKAHDKQNGLDKTKTPLDVRTKD